MVTPAFLRGVVELATCETVDALLHHAVALIERELGVRASIELFDRDDAHLSRGEVPGIAPSVTASTAPHRTWIGMQYTLGAIYLSTAPADTESIELLACQLAPLAERLVEREASERRTIREDIDRLYERRIRDALLRCDWNASAVARELFVSRRRVAEVARRWRTRPLTVWPSDIARDTNCEPNRHNSSEFPMAAGDNDVARWDALDGRDVSRPDPPPRDSTRAEGRGA